MKDGRRVPKNGGAVIQFKGIKESRGHCAGFRRACSSSYRIVVLTFLADTQRASQKTNIHRSVCFVLKIDRREAAQVHRLQQGLQPIVQPDHSHAQTHRLQAVRLWPVRQSFPAQGGPEKTSRQSASVDGSSAAAAAAALGPQIRPDGQLDVYLSSTDICTVSHLESHSFSQCTFILLMTELRNSLPWNIGFQFHILTDTHTRPCLSAF